MSRISLVEAYDNRDVIGQLVRLREDVNELQNILKDIDPDGDLTNVVTKTGDQTIDGIKTFVGKIVADCDIIQLGGNYETHAEQVYSKNDYIVMRDEAVSGLAPGTYSGFQIKKYNGSDDARLVVDNEGVARVGDLNDEQPLMTRDEAADMTSGNILLWDGVNKKAITSAKSVSDIETEKVSGTGNIGSDTKPVKIVNGEAVAVTGDLVVHQYDSDATKSLISSNTSGTATITVKNGWCCISLNTDAALTTAAYDLTAIAGCPQPASNYVCAPIMSGNTVVGLGYIYTSYNNDFRISSYATTASARMTLTYPIKE